MPLLVFFTRVNTVTNVQVVDFASNRASAFPLPTFSKSKFIFLTCLRIDEFISSNAFISESTQCILTRFFQFFYPFLTSKAFLINLIVKVFLHIFFFFITRVINLTLKLLQDTTNFLFRIRFLIINSTSTSTSASAILSFFNFLFEFIFISHNIKPRSSITYSANMRAMDLFTKEYSFMRALPIFINEVFIVRAFNFVKASTTYVMNVVATFITYN